MKRTKKKKSILEKFLYKIDTDLELAGYDFSVWKVICFILGFAAAVPGFILMIDEKICLLLYIGSFVLLAIYPVINIISNFKKERLLCESLFILTAAALSMLLKEYKAAVMILFGFNILRLLESYFTDKQRLKMGTIVDLIPEETLLIIDGSAVHKKPSRIRKGDYVGVNSNSVIPIDGIVINGSTTVDYSSLSNSEYSVPVVKGSKVYSGGFNQSEPIIIQSDCEYSDCFIQRMLTSCQDSLEYKFDDKLVTALGIAVPLIIITTVIIGLICPIFNHSWVENARICIYLLLICCPYGIFNTFSLINFMTVLSLFSNGAIIRSSLTVDLLGKASTLICNKTGTLTESDFTIDDVYPEGISINNFLSMLLNVESNSQNPMARALRRYCGVFNSEKAVNLNAVEIPGNGIEATIDGNRILVGNSKFLFNSGIFSNSTEKPGPVVHVAVNDKYCGNIQFINKIRSTTANAIESIRSNGLKNFVLVSGDIQSYVRSVASSLGFNVSKAEIDINGKASVTDYLMDNRAGNRTVVYVGNMLDEQEAASHADVSVSTDMIRDMDNIGKADIDILGGGLSTFAKIYSAAVNKLFVCRIILITYIITKVLLVILSLAHVMPILLFALIMSMIMTAIFVFISIRLGNE